jgi:heme/copper-type cytochrome/quinol oxidase subunit 2
MEVNPYAAPTSNLQPKTAESAPSLWNPDAAGAWSLLFTPIFGSVLVMRNWQAIGEDAEVRKAKIWLGVSVVMVIAGLFVPGLALAYLIGWYFGWQKSQTKYVESRWQKSYPHKGWMVPLLIGFMSLGALYFIILGALRNVA